MSVTSASLQAQLGANALSPKITHELPPYGAAVQVFVVQGGATYPGVFKNMTTTASDAAATQAATVATKMRKGGDGHDAT